MEFSRNLFFTHYALLVAAILLILSDEVSYGMLHKAQQCLNRFYEMFATHYGKQCNTVVLLVNEEERMGAR